MAPLLNGMKTMAMQGSSSEESYEKHSSFQNQVFQTIGKQLLEKAVKQVLCNLAVRTVESNCGRKHIAIADFGCSYGRNTINCAEVILGALQHNWAEQMTTDKMPEVQYLFIDLPSNDFNSLFQSLQPYLHHPPHSKGVAASSTIDVNLPKIYAAGVPGSFHGRLLPSTSLDLAISTYCLHWLSKIPASVLDRSSPAWNGGSLWIHNAPQDTVDAYTLQSQIDMTNFLKSRAQELASGGVLFLLVGSSLNISKDGSVEPNQGARYEIFKSAWQELVKEGIITMEEFETFNMPIYPFNDHHLKDLFDNVPEFKILHMETVEEIVDKVDFSLSRWVDIIVSAAKPTVETHLGKEKSELLFKRLSKVASGYHGLTVAHKVVVASLQRL